jgi:hypothetical protein
MLRFWRYSPLSQISWPIYCRSDVGVSPPCWRQSCSRRYSYSGHIIRTACRFRHRLRAKSLRSPRSCLPRRPSRKGRAILSRISRLPQTTDRRVRFGPTADSGAATNDRRNAETDVPRFSCSPIAKENQIGRIGSGCSRPGAGRRAGAASRSRRSSVAMACRKSAARNGSPSCSAWCTLLHNL